MKKTAFQVIEKAIKNSSMTVTNDQFINVG